MFADIERMDAHACAQYLAPDSGLLRHRAGLRRPAGGRGPAGRL